MSEKEKHTLEVLDAYRDLMEKDPFKAGQIYGQILEASEHQQCPSNPK